MLDCLGRDEAPFLSALLYTQVLDDAEPDERKLGIGAGLVWGASAEATVVYEDRGISHGMRLGIERAHAAGRDVIFRKLPGYDEDDFTDGAAAECCRFHYLGGARSEECRSASSK